MLPHHFRLLDQVSSFDIKEDSSHVDHHVDNIEETRDKMQSLACSEFKPEDQRNVETVEDGEGDYYSIPDLFGLPIWINHEAVVFLLDRSILF